MHALAGGVRAPLSRAGVLGGHHARRDAAPLGAATPRRRRDRRRRPLGHLCAAGGAHRPPGGEPVRPGAALARARRLPARQLHRSRLCVLRADAHRRHPRDGAARAPARRGPSLRRACAGCRLPDSGRRQGVRLSGAGAGRAGRGAVAAPGGRRRGRRAGRGRPGRAAVRAGLGRRARAPARRARLRTRRRRVDDALGRHDRPAEVHPEDAQRLRLQL